MEGLSCVCQNLGASGLFVRNKLGFFFAPSSGKDLLLLLQLWVEKLIAKVLQVIVMCTLLKRGTVFQPAVK